MHVVAGGGPASFACVLACRKSSGHSPVRALHSAQWVMGEQIHMWKP